MTDEPTEKSGLEKTIDSLLTQMSVVDADSEAYAAMTNQLVKIYALKEIDKPKRLTPDTLAIVVGNLLGIVLIVGHERANIITSKAMNILLKLR